MATAIFGADGLCSVDFLTPDTNYDWVCNCGVQYLGGGSKSLLRRPLMRFDVGGPALEGRPLTPTDELTAAEFVFDITLVIAASQPARVDRITRETWDYTVATWNKYDGVNTWTAGGGDFATPTIMFTGPAGTGEFVVTGALDFVTDALANRDGIVHAGFRMTDENPAVDELWSAESGQLSTLRPRLRVTYVERNPSPINHPNPSPRHPMSATPDRARPAARPASPAPPERTRKP